MDEIAHFTPAMIIENDRKVKGLLCLFEKGYMFNESYTNLDWEKAACKQEVQEGKAFLFKSKMPVVVFCEGNTVSPRFILEKKKDERLILEEIDRLAKSVKEKRIAAEEEQKRREEEERRRKEEERKRKEEEERRRKAEEERKRKEEEERKRREEERKRREEAERKRREEERKRREEEERKRREEKERKRKEALAKKLNARKQRIQTAVDKAKAHDFKMVKLSENADLSIKKAWSLIADNPYRILGISVAATSEEANASLDKIKKLDRLHAIASFRSVYQLKGTENPERDLSIAQNALSSLKSIEYKWFWFADPDACTAWQEEMYLRELSNDGIEYGTYDLFLANYLYAMVFDPAFTKEELWKSIFIFINYLCMGAGSNVLKSRFNEKELQNISDDVILKSFKKEIFKPVEALCESNDSALIFRVYSCVKKVSGANLDPFRKRLAPKLSNWFSLKEKEMCLYLKKYDDMDRISAAAAKEIESEGCAYLNQVKPALQMALFLFKDEQVRHDMVQESFRNPVWQIMCELNKADDKKAAISFANECYPYCSDDDKRKIRNTFGFTAIKGCDKDVTNADWDIMGDNYYNGDNGYSVDYNEAFKWYMKAANAGNKYSQNSLGICYQKGRGTYQSDYEAARWFEKAYYSGSADGTFNLALCYTTGTGKIQDKQKALELYLEAAKMGHPAAAEAGKKLVEIMKAEMALKMLSRLLR